MGKVKRDLVGQTRRNLEKGLPANHRKPWSVKDLVLVARHLPTKDNREFLADYLERSEASIDYVWYDLYRSKKSWNQEFPEGLTDYAKDVLKARKIVGLTRVFTPVIGKE